MRANMHTQTYTHARVHTGEVFSRGPRCVHKHTTWRGAFISISQARLSVSRGMACGRWPLGLASAWRWFYFCGFAACHVHVLAFKAGLHLTLSMWTPSCPVPAVILVIIGVRFVSTSFCFCSRIVLDFGGRACRCGECVASRLDVCREKLGCFLPA